MRMPTRWCLSLTLISGLSCLAQDTATPAAPPDDSKEIRPFPGIVAYPDEQRIELESKVCLEGGWLEQIACAPGSREHESLVVVRAKPSQIHAAMLLVVLPR